MLKPGMRVSLLMVRRTADVPIITIEGTVEGYDGGVIRIRGRRTSHSSLSYHGADREQAVDKEMRLFLVPLSSVRLIEAAESAGKGTDVVAEELPMRQRRGRSGP